MSFNQPTNKKDFEYMNRTTPIEDWEKEAYDFAMSLRSEIKGVFYGEFNKNDQETMKKLWENPKVREIYRLSVEAGNYEGKKPDTDKMPEGNGFENGLSKFIYPIYAYYETRLEAIEKSKGSQEKQQEQAPAVAAPNKKGWFQKLTENLFGNPTKAKEKEKEEASANAQKKVKIYDPDFKLTKEEEQAILLEHAGETIPDMDKFMKEQAAEVHAQKLMAFEAIKGIANQYLPKDITKDLNEDNIFNFLKIGNTYLNEGKYKDMAPLDKANLFISKIREFNGLDVFENDEKVQNVDIKNIANKVKPFNKLHERLKEKEAKLKEKLNQNKKVPKSGNVDKIDASQLKDAKSVKNVVKQNVNKTDKLVANKAKEKQDENNDKQKKNDGMHK